jgi:anti-anti-sigma factor
MTNPLDVELPVPEPLDVETAVDGSVIRVGVAGDVDLSNVGVLEARVRRVFEEHAISRLVLDLRGTTFLDSMGLRLLLELHRDADRGHWRLIVVRGPEAVQRTIQIMGLEQLLEFVDDPAQALEKNPASD